MKNGEKLFILNNIQFDQ